MSRRHRRFARRFSPERRAVMASINRLLQERPKEAGGLLAEMAGEFQRRGMPLQAANLHARAAHAYVDGGNEQAALAQASAALRLFLQLEMVQRSPIFYANITQKMEERGMSGAAEALRLEFAAQIPALPARPPAGGGPADGGPAGGGPRHGLLPTNCPNCGAAVYPEEIEWVDASTAACDYCGSLIRSLR